MREREAVLVEEIRALTARLDRKNTHSNVRFKPRPPELCKTPVRRGSFAPPQPARAGFGRWVSAEDVQEPVETVETTPVSTTPTVQVGTEEALLLAEVGGMLQAMPTGAMALLLARLRGVQLEDVLSSPALLALQDRAAGQQTTTTAADNSPHVMPPALSPTRASHTAAVETDRLQRLRRVILAFFVRHEPTAVPHAVDALIDAVADGRLTEARLFHGLEERYGAAIHESPAMN